MQLLIRNHFCLIPATTLKATQILDAKSQTQAFVDQMLQSQDTYPAG